MALSKQFWCLKNKGLTPEIKWSILKKSNTPNSFNGRCNLCLEEKIYILIHKWPDKLLDKRSELIARRRHKTKFKLQKFKNIEINSETRKKKTFPTYTLGKKLVAN